MTTYENFDPERGLSLFRQMLRIRGFDEAAAAALRRGEFKGPVHTSVGQEAVASGICANLDATDIITSTHRGHAHVLAKGSDLFAMFSELYGRASGLCGGKGGSMHIADFSLGVFGANGVVGAGIVIAVGAAHGTVIRGENKVTVCFIGDGAINRGPFLEGLNWARLYDLPILFVCEDNHFSSGTRTSGVTAGPGVVARAESLGVPATTVDGNDVVAVDRLAGELIAGVRGGSGPRLLHALTYRLQTHSIGDSRPIDRVGDELDRWWSTEPISRCRCVLLGAGVQAAVIERVELEVEAELREAEERARQAPWPPLEAAFLDVQDAGAPR